MMKLPRVAYGDHLSVESTLTLLILEWNSQLKVEGKECKRINWYYVYEFIWRRERKLWWEKFGKFRTPAPAAVPVARE